MGLESSSPGNVTWLDARRGRPRGRDCLLDAAYGVMTETGFFGATGAEIAARAGVPEAEIWRYFRSKYDLCLTVLVEAMGS